MDVLHVHVVENVVHVLHGDRPSIEQRDEGIEVLLFLIGDRSKGGRLVDLVGTRDKGRAGRPSLQRDLFVRFDRAIRSESRCEET